MDIKVNGRPFSIDIYDDNTSILIKWALDHPFIKLGDTEIQMIPEFLRYEGHVILEPNSEINIVNIFEELQPLDPQSLRKDFFALGQKYPNLRSTVPDKKNGALIAIGCFYILQENNNFIPILQNISNTYFSKTLYTSVVNQFLENINNFRKILEKKSKTLGTIGIQLKNTKPTKIGNFVKTEINFETIILNVPESIRTIDVFNLMRVSTRIPIINYNFKNLIDESLSLNYNKVFSHLPKSVIKRTCQKKEGVCWTNIDNSFKETDIEAIYFIIQTSKDNYSIGNWVMIQNVNRITIQLRNDDIEPETLINYLIEHVSLKDLSYTSINSKPIGYFEIPNFTLNKAVFLDLALTNNLFRYFIFFDEGNKPTLSKAKFEFFYQLDQQGTLRNLPRISIYMKNRNLTVKFHKAMDISEVESFRRVFSRLLTIYTKYYESIVKDYKEVGLTLDNYTITATQTDAPIVETNTEHKGKLKIPMGTTNRRKKLQEFDNTLFGAKTDYVRSCQRTPYQVDPELFEQKLGKKFIATARSLGKTAKIEDAYVEYPEGSSNYFSCFPSVNPEDDNDKKFIFATIKENKYSKIHKEPYPVPCCLTTPQVSTGKIVRKLKKEDKEISVKTIVNPQKATTVLKEKTFGQLPENVKTLLKLSGSPNQYLMAGVGESPNSFLHCLELAFNPKVYVLISSKAKKEAHVRKLRAKFADSNLAVCKQEFYDYSYEDIQKYLRDWESYFDPDLVLRLAEEYYRCNIILFQMDPIEGVYSIPRNTIGYLYRDINPTLPTVTIIKGKTHLTAVPFNCNLVTMKKGTKTGDPYIDDIFRDKLISTFRTFYKIKIKDTYGDIHLYKPWNWDDPILKDCESQFIDSYGKCQILNYPNLSLIVPPMLPINLLDTGIIKYEETSLDVAKKFMKSRKLELVSQDGNISQGIRGIWVERQGREGQMYIPLEVTKAIENLPFSAKINPMIEGKTNSLDKYYAERDIARILSQASLFLYYEVGPDQFSLENFIVDKDWKYDIPKIMGNAIKDNPHLFENGKLVVPSKEILKRLINNIKVDLLNGKGQPEYIHNTYTSINDFIKNEYQFLFLKKEVFLDWLNSNL